MSETAIVIKQDQTPAAIETGSIFSMLDRVITDPNLPMERVNQAFDFYERVEKRNARLAFDAAMAKARAKIKPIVKSTQVSFGNTNYKHETLADIANAVDPILAEFGLSYRFRTHSAPGQPITVTCILSHELGHSEENSLTGPPDASGSKNPLQQIGSTLIYLQRYTIKASLGLAATHDDDGQGGVQRKSSAAAKKDGTDKKFNEIKLDFETATSADHLRHLGETWADTIAELPSRWSDLLRDTYEDRAADFRAKAS